jgi:hypothetical protein
MAETFRVRGLVAFSGSSNPGPAPCPTPRTRITGWPLHYCVPACDGGSAAMLADVPVGESPTGGECSLTTVVISDRGKGD